FLELDLQTPGRERPREQKLLRVLRDVDEAAGAREPASEPADIDVSIGVRLRHAQACEIEPAAIVKVELLILLDDGLRLERRSEIEPALRYAADDSGLCRQRPIFENALLRRDCGDPFRHADAQIHHAPERQLKSTAPRDDLALVERHLLDAIERHALAA